MLHSLRLLKGSPLAAKDGTIGKVHDIYFDDYRWTIRYLVVATGSWLAGREYVLISPLSIEKGFRYNDVLISVDLTREQIKNSPSFESHQPVSRQLEIEYFNYFGWPYYWAFPGTWGYGIYPYHLIEVQNNLTPPEPVANQKEDSHLRSAFEVKGYGVESLDGRMGSVEDFLLEDETWSIRYLVIDTIRWWPSKKVLISPTWCSQISWMDHVIKIDLTKDTIKRSPPYDSKAFLNRSYEQSLHGHYVKKPYWDDMHGY